MLFLLLLALPGMAVSIDFVYFLTTGKRIERVAPALLIGLAEFFVLIVLPWIYGNFGKDNDCCADEYDTAVFAPAHQTSIGVLIVLCLLVYVYARVQTALLAPLAEVFINVVLLIGIVFNVFVGIHTNELWLALIGNLPIMLLFLLALAKRQQLFLEHAKTAELGSKNAATQIAFNVLSLNIWLKFPVLLVLCLPVLLVLVGFLLLFGQQPDALVRAFTDTYKHGFSQLDYQCENVQCGGHFLCSVAAKGHTQLVKPQRIGIRNGHYIVCNRQLLVSNAFEELIEERMGFIHKMVRYQYNKVGNLIHRYYRIFDIKLVSDCIYLLMKPLEWFFVLILYSFDRTPENRIAKQYLSRADRQSLATFISVSTPAPPNLTAA